MYMEILDKPSRPAENVAKMHCRDLWKYILESTVSGFKPYTCEVCSDTYMYMEILDKPSRPAENVAKMHLNS